MIRNGLYGLFSLDGAPIDPRDRAIVLGPLAETALDLPGALVAASDRSASPVHVHRGADGLAILLGDLDEPETVAARLALAPATDAAALATAAQDRWGHAASTALAGEWLLLRWHGSHADSGATLTLLMAEGAHEHCHVATDGRRVAIAPDLARLARLPWVDSAFDPDMLMRTMGRAALRLSVGSATILKGVSRLRAGTQMTIGRNGVRIADPPAWVAPPSPTVAVRFDDAVDELDTLLRRIVRRRIAGARGVAIGTSGGLDSALMGVLAVQECRDQPLVCLTSAAPMGSGIADERDWAGIVARHLGLPLVAVTPGAEADVYAPSARHFAAHESPSLSPRHYLYEALGDAAVAAGAQWIVDGSYGEMTISNHGFGLAGERRASLRDTARDLRDRWRGRFAPLRTEAYHVMPARGALAHVTAPRPPFHAPRRLSADAPFGFEDGIERIGQLPGTTHDPRLRTLYPLRDPRLIRLMASFPAGYVRAGGIDRAPIRALLARHLPEAVVTRPKGLAFSPTYPAMLQAQADAAIERIDAQRRAGAGDWLDLAWLARMLGQIRDGRALPLETRARIQGTAYAAAFFDWWHGNARTTSV